MVVYGLADTELIICKEVTGLDLLLQLVLLMFRPLLQGVAVLNSQMLLEAKLKNDLLYLILGFSVHSQYLTRIS